MSAEGVAFGQGSWSAVVERKGREKKIRSISLVKDLANGFASTIRVYVWLMETLLVNVASLVQLGGKHHIFMMWPNSP